MGRAEARPIAVLGSTAGPYTQVMELVDVLFEHKRLGAIVHLATVTPSGDPHVALVYPVSLRCSKNSA